MILDFDKKEIKEGSEIIFNSKKGQSFYKVKKENEKFFAFNDMVKVELTESLIKVFKIQRWKNQ